MNLAMLAQAIPIDPIKALADAAAGADATTRILVAILGILFVALGGLFYVQRKDKEAAIVRLQAIYDRLINVLQAEVAAASMREAKSAEASIREAAALEHLAEEAKGCLFHRPDMHEALVKHLKGGA